MPNTFNWQNAIYDPRFWAMRYEGLLGITWEEVQSYMEESDFFNLAILEDDPLAGYVGEGDDPQLAEVEVGSRRLTLSFPEGYIWLIDFAAEDSEYLTGIYHAIFHPDMDPEGFLHPTSMSLSLAEESGHQRLPGLRWAELKQIQTCLAQNWSGDFDVQAVISLLYPVVRFITFDELEDVRHTLTIAWQDLRIVNAKQVASWLNDQILVYDRGRILRLDDQKEWKPLPGERVYEGELYGCKQKQMDGKPFTLRASDTSRRIPVNLYRSFPCLNSTLEHGPTSEAFFRFPSFLAMRTFHM